LDTLYRLQTIFRDVFENPTLQISEQTSVSNFPDWDSVAMVQIVLATEEEFGVRFTTDQVAGIKSVADIRRSLEVHAT
jgi:acyl carrier protein